MLETGKNWVGETGRCEPSGFFFFFFFPPYEGGGRDGMRFNFPENRREFLSPSSFYLPPKKGRVVPFQPLGEILGLSKLCGKEITEEGVGKSGVGGRLELRKSL